mgnify:CR=1 FL=1
MSSYNFKDNLRACIDSGAQGFMAGDPFWTNEIASRVPAIMVVFELAVYKLLDT